VRSSTFVVYGALLIVGFDLHFWQALIAVLVGNSSYIVNGLGSPAGPRAGTAAFTINRAPFGPNGAKLIAGFNWMTQVGYEVLGLYLVYYYLARRSVAQETAASAPDADEAWLAALG
jgi:NCS1 family nucleobase:cation symporter-1